MAMSNVLTDERSKIGAFAGVRGATAVAPQPDYEQIYAENKHRIYSLAFWMVDNELEAEELTNDVFCRAFARPGKPRSETIDSALVAELRENGPIGILTLECGAATEVLSVRTRVKRVDLERAIVQLPRTERMIFLLHDVEQASHARIARLLGLSEAESRSGLHQARLRMRELLAKAS